MTTLTADSVRDELVRRLSGLSAGDVSVESVDVTDEWGIDDDPAIRLVLHLSDPDGETWDTDDIMNLGHQVNTVLQDFRGLPEVRTFLTGGPPEDDLPIPDEDGLEPE
jgi:hypothetical protein